MKSVQEIYSDYHIMPALQMHQSRVAAVAQLIVESSKELVDTESIVLACLFHDMGNIIKSDFDYFPEFLQPEGREYWQGVKDEFIKKYGDKEEVATEMIAREINLSLKALDCIQHIGFSHATENELSHVMEYKICNYADMRVGPYGVILMQERIAEANKRYQGRKHSIASDQFEALVNSLHIIEKQIFEKSPMLPEDITDEKIKDIIVKLRDLKI